MRYQHILIIGLTVMALAFTFYNAKFGNLCAQKAQQEQSAFYYRPFDGCYIQSSGEWVKR